MRGSKVKALRKTIVGEMARLNSKVSFNTVFRRAKKAYNQGDISLCRS